MREAGLNLGGNRQLWLRRALWLLPFVLAAAFMLWESRGQTLYADEWYFFPHAAGGDPSWVLEPDQGNLVFGAALVYKLTLAVAGAHDHLALRLVWVALDLLCAGLFFALMRTRVGAFAAFVPALVLSVFGASWELFCGSLGINVLTSVAAGLGALLALERRTTRGDALACLLLTFSVISHSTGLAIAAGVIGSVLIEPGRWRRIWVVAVPLLLYAAWWVWARKFSQSTITLETISSAPAALVSLFGAAVSSMSGTFRYPGAQAPGTPNLVISVNQQPGLLLGALLIGAAAWRLAKVRFSWRFLPPVVTLLVYWASLALVSPAREPTTGRYQYASAIFILLILAELWRGYRPSNGVKASLAAIGLVALIPNMINLHYATAFVRGVSEQDKAKLAIVEELRERIEPETIIEPTPGTIDHDMAMHARHYFQGVDAFGSPAYRLDELPAAGAEPRMGADQELVYLLGVHVVPVYSRPSGGECRTVAPGSMVSGGGLPVSAGGFAFRLRPHAEATIGLRRYGDDFQRLQPAVGAGWYRVLIPRDRISLPWLATVESSARVLVCSL